ncbi:MAG: site-specific integrase [Sphingobacteriaceae bacterium]|nr:site-specific integrase [Sphingobacteriaceae bacterium]
MLKDKISISLYLDSRRKKTDGTYPLKLKLYKKSTKERLYYKMDFSFTESDFNGIWNTNKPSPKFQKIREQLIKIEAEANEIKNKMVNFNLEEFERMMKIKDVVLSNDLKSFYDRTIAFHHENEQVKTASNYRCSFESLKKFNDDFSPNFDGISPAWLKKYEDFMLKSGKTYTTIGFYLRPLRAIMNQAIEKNIIDLIQYPFGKGKYTIPAPKGTKKALSKEQLKILFKGVPNNEHQKKAKDFWFFSYACNGMNFKDIANLKVKNLESDSFSFFRSKTKNTNKQQAAVLVPLNDFTRNVIDTYRVKSKYKEDFIFPVICAEDNAVKQSKDLENFIRYTNQHFGKYADELGIKGVSTYTARHSFATNAIRSGASMEFVSEALSHSNINTTKTYFAGFENERKKEILDKIMNFD